MLQWRHRRRPPSGHRERRHWPGPWRRRRPDRLRDLLGSRDWDRWRCTRACKIAGDLFGGRIPTGHVMDDHHAREWSSPSRRRLVRIDGVARRPTSITLAADIASSRSVNDLSFNPGVDGVHTMTPWAMLEGSQAERRDVRHDDAVRRSLMVLAGTFVVSGAVAIPDDRLFAADGSHRGWVGWLRKPQFPGRDRRRWRRGSLRCRHQSLPGGAGAEPLRHPRLLQVAAHHAYSLVGGGCGQKASLGFPTGVAVDHAGDVYIAEATDQRILMIRPAAMPRPPWPAQGHPATTATAWPRAANSTIRQGLP